MMIFLRPVVFIEDCRGNQCTFTRRADIENSDFNDARAGTHGYALPLRIKR